jgi:hypothetical protein
VRPVDHLLEPAAARVDHDGCPVALVECPVREIEAGRRDRLGRRRHREMDEAAHAARHLAVHGGRGVEILDLGRDLDVELSGVERGDEGDARATPKQRVPVFASGIADRCHGADARDDGAARGASGRRGG